MKNQDETDIDCGGSTCSGCADGNSCAAGSDCLSETCNQASHKCVFSISPGPSCEGMQGNECAGTSCCEALAVPSGSYMMGRSDNGSDACPSSMQCKDWEQPEHPATVDGFYADTFEVTVGRFRRFVEAYTGNAPSTKAGAHSKISGSGWDSAWDAKLPSTQGDLINSLNCGDSQTWKDSSNSGHEQYAINCVTWYEAFAFCIWDGGTLPTEAEWEYMAAGGSANRLYPWGSQSPNAMRAYFDESGSSPSSLINVGMHPKGAGRWGQLDLAGNMAEWVLDVFDTQYYNNSSPCTNCAKLSGGLNRTQRGGNWVASAVYLRSTDRRGNYESVSSSISGFRCIRFP